MTTLLITNVFPPQTGGSGRWFWEVYRRLPREEFAIAAGEHPQQHAFDQTHDLKVVRLPLALKSWGVASPSSMRAYARLYYKLKSLVRRHAVEAVHAGCCLPEGFLAYLLKRWLKIPYLLYVHGEELKIAAGSRELAWMARRVLAGAKLIIANSENTARILRHGWKRPDTQIRILHPGADMKRFIPAPPDSAVRAKLGWRSRPVILTVGRLQKRKGHDMLLRAMPEILKAVPNALYSIVGDGEERENLVNLASDLNLRDHVQFLGELNDDQLVGCYQQCDLFVLPNREVAGDIEGFGMVLVEAQACAKPVMAGDSGGTSETMLVPDTGQIADADSSEALAKAVSALLLDQNLRRSMGISGREWVVHQFDWDSIARRSWQIFQAERNVLSFEADSESLLR